MAGLATAATVLQLAGVAYKAVDELLKVVNEVRRAEEHVKEFEKELRYTRFLIDGSRTVLATFHESDGDGPDDYDPLAELRSEFQELTEAIQSVKDGDNVRRIKWLREAKRCRRLAKGVKSHRKRIFEMIIVLQSPTSRRPSDDSFQLLNRIAQGDIPISATVPAEGDTSQTDSLLQHPQNESALSRRHSADAVGTADRLSDNTFIGPVLSDSKGSCSPGCRCTCHYDKARRNSTPAVRASITPIAGRFGYGSFTSKCSVPQCRNKQRNRGQFMYSYPFRTMHRIITVSILYEGLKFRSYFDVPTYVPDVSDVMRAAVNGDFKTFKRLFEKGIARKNDTGIDGWTTLHNAAYNGRRAIVEYLLERGANPEAVEINNRKASHFAMIKALKKGATEEEHATVAAFGKDVKKRFRADFRMTPIHACVLHLQDDHPDRDSSLLPILLALVEEANKAPIDQDWSEPYPTIGDQTPLFTEVLEMFRERTNWLRANNRADERVFLDLHNQPDAHDWTPLHWAAYAGCFNELKTLLEHGATTMKLTTSRRNILHHAAESGNSELLGYLFENRDALYMSTMNIDQQDLWGETPLHIAATRSAACVSYLIHQGARLDLKQADGETALHFAGQAPDAELVPTAEPLTRNCKSLVRVKDKSGRTPTFNLLRSSECVQLLISRGAQMETRDRKKRSLLHEACSKGYWDSLGLILARCPRRLITRADDEGATPLDAAFTCCTIESARCAALILRRDDVTIQPKVDKKGWTILHHAARLGNLEVLKLVLQADRFNFDDLIGSCTESLQQIVIDGLGKWEGEFKELLEEFGTKVRQSSVMRERAMNKPELYAQWGAWMYKPGG